ncbi:MAG: carbohydrate ABC transporter permease [Firmicutes bacterium]|nr:carbohydrate ABC transporter permease [Bacillota bacterium]
MTTSSLTRKQSVGHIVFKVLMIAFLLFFTVLALLPFAWMLSSSLKLDKDVFHYPIEWIPAVPHWDNYVTIWQSVPLLVYFKNTALLSTGVTLMQIVTSSFAAYAFAKMSFKGRDLLFLCYIGTIAIPWQVYMLPQFILMRGAGLYDTLFALLALQSFSAFGVFLMRQFFLSVPNELCEAARIDGLSEYGIWARIMLPLSKPAIATLIIFTFIGTWNDFMGPLIYLRSDAVKTIQVGLRRFIQEYSSDYHLIMAASVCSVIPVGLVFLFMQRYFIEGIATTGIKG